MRITGYVEDTSLEHLTVDGQEIAFPRYDYHARFEHDVKLRTWGEQKVELGATDRAGHRSTQTISFVRLRPREVVSLRSWRSDRTNPGVFQLRGKLHPSARYGISSLTVNGTVLPVTEGAFSAKVTLQPQDSTILQIKILISGGELIELPYDLVPRPIPRPIPDGKSKFGKKGAFGGK